MGVNGLHLCDFSRPLGYRVIVHLVIHAGFSYGEMQ